MISFEDMCPRLRGHLPHAENGTKLLFQKSSLSYVILFSFIFQDEIIILVITLIIPTKTYLKNNLLSFLSEYGGGDLKFV